MVLEKLKYIQSEKDNELSYLNKELSSIRQKCSLLEMSIEDHQAENKRLKRELSEIEMSHNLEREKVECCNVTENVIVMYHDCVFCSLCIVTALLVGVLTSMGVGIWGGAQRPGSPLYFVASCM